MGDGTHSIGCLHKTYNLIKPELEPQLSFLI